MGMRTTLSLLLWSELGCLASAAFLFTGVRCIRRPQGFWWNSHMAQHLLSLAVIFILSITRPGGKTGNRWCNQSSQRLYDFLSRRGVRSKPDCWTGPIWYSPESDHTGFGAWRESMHKGGIQLGKREVFSAITCGPYIHFYNWFTIAQG